METRKCIECSNNIIINSYIEITPCQHAICYTCLSFKLLTKSFHYYLNKDTKEFKFKCTKCSQSNCGSISLTYEKVNSILSSATSSKSTSTSNNKEELYCQLHKAKYEFYCHTCKSSICSECTSNEHKYHQWILIKEYKAKLRNVTSTWIHKSYKDIEDALKRNSETVIEDLDKNYTLFSDKINSAINELKAYLAQIAIERERKLKEIKSFTEIIKRIYRKYYTDIEEMDFKDINDVKYLSKVKYEYNKMIFKPYTITQPLSMSNNDKDAIIQLPVIKQPCISYSFIRLKKLSITFSSKIRKIKECLTILNTKNPVGNVLILNENEIYFSSGSLLSDSKDKTIQIFNIKQRKFDKIDTNHDNSVICLCQIDCNRIASGSYDSTIKLWNVLMRKEVGILIGHKASITSLCLWKTDVLISGSIDSFIMIWDLINKKCLSSYSVDTEGVYCISIVDNILYTGGQSNEIKVLCIDYNNGVNSGNNGNSNSNRRQEVSMSQIGVLKGHSNSITALSLNKGSKIKRIASGSKDSTIRIWKRSNGKCIGVLLGHNYVVTDLTYLLDNRLASSSKDKTIRIWNMNSMSCDIVLQAQDGPVLALSLLSDGRLLSGFKNNMIRIWG